MLTQASDYRYCSPIAAGIQGKPFALLDGTPKGRAVRYEDLVFLLEMYCERLSWASRDEASALSRSALHFDNIVSRLPNTYAGLRLILLEVGGGGYIGCLHNAIETGPSIIAANWTFVSPPVIAEGNSFPDWVASMKPQLRTDTYLDDFRDEYGIVDSGAQILPRVEEADTLRMIYNDLADIKRYLFPSNSYAFLDHSSFVTRAGNGDFDNVADALFGPVCVGNRTIVDGDYSTEVPESSFAWPWRAEYYEQPLNGDPTLRLSHSESQLRLYIKAPYFLNPAINPATPYYTRPNLYAKFQVAARWSGPNDAPSGYVTRHMIHPLFYTPLVSTVSIGPFEGEISISKDNVGMALSIAYSAAKNWAQGSLSGFQDNYWSLSIQLEGFYLDTGIITHNAVLPPTP